MINNEAAPNMAYEAGSGTGLIEMFGGGKKLSAGWSCLQPNNSSAISISKYFIDNGLMRE